MQQSRPQALAHRKCAAHVRSNDCCGKTIFSTIGEFDRVIVGIKWHNDRHRPENLLVKRRVFRCYPTQYRRLKEKVTVLAADLEFRTSLLCLSDHLRHMIALRGIDKWPKRHISV